MRDAGEEEQIFTTVFTEDTEAESACSPSRRGFGEEPEQATIWPGPDGRLKSRLRGPRAAKSARGGRASKRIASAVLGHRGEAKTSAGCCIQREWL
jgi:hypothetical protein